MKEGESQSCPKPAQLNKVDIEDITLAREVIRRYVMRLEIGGNASGERLGRRRESGGRNHGIKRTDGEDDGIDEEKI